MNFSFCRKIDFRLMVVIFAISLSACQPSGVREEKALSLMDAIRKSSLMPAQRLEVMSPQMRQKGRIKVGADADIGVFDPARVIDKATYQNPAQYSEGFRYVLVEGTFVVSDGKLQDVTPGQGIRAR